MGSDKKSYFKKCTLKDFYNQCVGSQFDVRLYTKNLNNELEKVESHIHSFLPERERKSRLLADAATIQKTYKNSLEKPSLYEIPVGIKDIFRVDGFSTQAGSKLPTSEFEGKEATVVTTLKQAGALILGKTVSTEFAYAEPGETVNPHNPEYSPGGSSSGSAAAVAAGLCPLTIGSQTIGSTLRPASYCGVVGFKCSYGRIKTDGMIPFSKSLDTVGMFTQDVSGMITSSKVVFETWNKTTEKNTLPILGIPDGNYLHQADPDVLYIFNKTAERLEQSGYRIKKISLFKNIDELNQSIWTLAAYEFAESQKKWYPKYKELYREKTKGLIEKGLQISSEIHLQLLDQQQKLRGEIQKIMKKNGIDFWICPASNTYAPKTLQSTGNPVMNIPWTFAGLPSISVPIKQSGDLPLGLQVVGKFNEDENLLLISKKIEKIVN